MVNHYHIITMILHLTPILLLITVLCDNSAAEFVYSDTSFVLSQKQTNLYWINELSNVCVSTSAATVYGVSTNDNAKMETLFHASGLAYSVQKDGLFSTSKVDPVYPIAILLATESKEYFQPYRLTNALIYLQRNGVDLSSVSSVFLQVGRQLSDNASILFKHYSSIISSNLGANLFVHPISPFCAQQLIIVSPRRDVKDMVYQMDSIYIRKAIYKGKPKYPIPPRRPEILVNVRKEVPMWQSIEPVKHYFKKILKAEKRTQFVTFSEMTTKSIIHSLQTIDVFVTCHGDETAFALFMVPYSVLIEIQPDYYHDSTTSILAYAADIYPIILRDVYSEKPKECAMEDGLILSEKEPCRGILFRRPIQFDIKSMTQAMAQTTYYLNNYKMKVVKY